MCSIPNRSDDSIYLIQLINVYAPIYWTKKSNQTLWNDNSFGFAFFHFQNLKSTNRFEDIVVETVVGPIPNGNWTVVVRNRLLSQLVTNTGCDKYWELESVMELRMEYGISIAAVHCLAFRKNKIMGLSVHKRFIIHLFLTIIAAHHGCYVVLIGSYNM